MNFSLALILAAAGGIGTFLRALFMGAAEKFAPSFPWATFVVNIVGSFAIGIAWALTKERTSLSPLQFKVIATGLLGGFTTFSAFSLDSILLLQEGAYARAALYIFLSPALGILSATGGIFLLRL